MKPVTKSPPTGKNSPNAPLSGESELARRGFVPATGKPEKKK